MKKRRAPKPYPTVPLRYELAAWIGFGLGLLAVLLLNLLPALIAGLLVYALVDLLVPSRYNLAADQERPRVLAVALIAAVVIALLLFSGLGLASLLRHSGETMPALIQRMAEIIEHSRERLPEWVNASVPTDTEELRSATVRWLRAHADVFQVAGAGLGRALAHILIGMVIGALVSLEQVHEGGRPLVLALTERARRLATAFRRVVFAQVYISGINTVFTAIYLVIVLPQVDIHLPFTKTLIVITFIAGLMPILGNLISNTVIFVVSLSQSLGVALASLIYLIAIHKLEYFLNARIIGSHIQARAWELLLAMLVMESAFGIAGLIAAPIYYAYLKDELSARQLV